MRVNKKNLNIGRKALIQVIGEDFCRQHRNTGVFCYGQEKKGLRCFLGICYCLDSNYSGGLSDHMDDWDVYASCYVKHGRVTMDRCRLPEGYLQTVNA